MLTNNAWKRVGGIIVGGFILFIVFCAAFLWGGIWLERRLVRVRDGVAKPTFPFADYSDDELRVIMPFAFEDALSRVPTRTPPEVTLKKFLDAMKKGDIDTAADQFVAKEREKWKTFLLGVQKKGMVGLMLKDLATAEKISQTDSLAQFDYTAVRNGKKIAGSVYFIKNTQGDWTIDHF